MGTTKQKRRSAFLCHAISDFQEKATSKITDIKNAPFKTKSSRKLQNDAPQIWEPF
ncbi:MAG: hypothetical protein ACOYJR_03250 [Acutalibacteraceae bacterium]